MQQAWKIVKNDAAHRKTADFFIDLLITFSPEVKLLELADTFFDLMFELEDLFAKKVDLVTEDSLRNPYFIASIERSKQLIYAAWRNPQIAVRDSRAYCYQISFRLLFHDIDGSFALSDGVYHLLGFQVL